MKITFPHLGNTYLAIKALFDGLGIEYILPPFSSREALEIGSKHSPEEMCLPFKIMIGNYIQSMEKGADTIIITGSCGPCRFGEYCELQMNILKKLGYNLDFIVLDMPKSIGLKELFKRIEKVSVCSAKSKTQKLTALKYAYNVIKLIDEIEEKAHYLSGYEIHKGQCKNLLSNCKIDAEKTNNRMEMIKVLKIYLREFEEVPIDKEKTPIKIAIIGEIYTIIEPFSNLYIEEKLMNYGVCTKRRLTPSWWVKDSALKIIKRNSLDIKKAAKDYLDISIGGFARESVGEAVIAERENFDGAIQIFPMGCMPEIVCKAILPSISKEKDFPIMSLVVDEMTGEAGYVTRIEAFIDMLERRKQNCIT